MIAEKALARPESARIIPAVEARWEEETAISCTKRGKIGVIMEIEKRMRKSRTRIRKKWLFREIKRFFLMFSLWEIG